MDELWQKLNAVSRENERLFERLVAGEQRYRGLARAVWRVEEAERRRLARELHDGIGQTLTALKNQLESLARRAAASDGKLADELLGSVTVASRALAETRELSRLLRPSVLDDLGLFAALRWLARSVETRAGIAVRLSLPESDPGLGAEGATLVFRVFQEGLNNVEKHARAAAAEVEVSAEDDVLRLRLRDDGCGFDADRAASGDQAATGLGLRGIRDRAELFGGRFRIRSALGEGTELDVELPLAAMREGR